MQIVPLVAVPSQTLTTILNNQTCQINVYQKQSGLYFDLLINGQDDPIVLGVLCQNLNRLVRDAYFGFQGDFCFIDSMAVNGVGADPVYTGLGAQFNLAYLTPDEVAAFPGE